MWDFLGGGSLNKTDYYNFIKKMLRFRHIWELSSKPYLTPEGKLLALSLSDVSVVH